MSLINSAGINRRRNKHKQIRYRARKYLHMLMRQTRKE